MPLRPRFSFDGGYVQRLIAGDPDTERHFTEYFGDLLTLKLRSRLRSAALAEDARQETFVRVLTALKKKGTLASPESLGAFVNAVCNNVLMETYRSTGRVDQLDDELDEPEAGEPSAEWRVLKDEERVKVREAIAALPQKDRDLIRWLFLEDRPKDDVCRDLNIDRDYLRVLFHRAKQRFRERYSAGNRRDQVTHEEAGQMLAAERYLLNEMPAEQRESFEEHFFACDECAEDLRAAAAMIRGARAGLAGATGSATVLTMPLERSASRRPAWQRSLALPWAAAAALACVVTYQSLWVVPSLRQDGSPRALVPVTLHPESRGGEAIVARRSPTDPVSLAVEINDPPQAGEVIYDLTTPEGRHVVSGHAATPPPGTPLLLLMPSWTLNGSMHYILSVHDAAASGRLLGGYRFAVSTQ